MKDTPQDKRSPWMVWTPLLLALMLVTGIGIGMQLRSGRPSLMFSPEDNLLLGGRGHGKLEELLRYIEAKYVDSVDRERLIQEAIDQVLYDLDPHSTYLSVDRVREEAEKLDGNFEGIGIEFMLLEDTIRVVSTVPGGPSEKAGILAGDNIITIEDSLAAGVGMETDEIMRRFATHEANVLIGTQMIAKGLDLPLVTLVGIVNADIGLYVPDLRAAEHTFQILAQVAGRAGRSVRM